MSHVSDTIGDSRPSWPTTHTIVFGVPGGIPASGSAVISFENDAFLLDPSFNYTDVSFAVSTSSPTGGFVPWAVGPSAGISDAGVSIVPGTGPITVAMPSGASVPPGAYVKMILGIPGGYEITNPSSTASYRIFIDTNAASGTAIDYGSAMVAILPAVGVDVNQYRTTPPVLSNALPTGTIPSNVLGVVVSFNADTYSTCRYATSSGVSYSAMTGTFSSDYTGTFQYTTITGITKGTTYTLYARCMDFTGNTDTSDYVISFIAGDPTGTGLGGGTSGQSYSGGGGGGGGGGAPYPAGPAEPALAISGIALPNVSISVLEDGVLLPSASTIADSAGNFSVTIPPMPEGTYSFTLLENGTGGTAIASYTTTITLISGTTNQITNILLPPGLSFATSTVGIGGTATIAGVAEPSSTVEIVVTSQSGAQAPVTATTTANATGAWSYGLSTGGFPADTYQIKARAFLPAYTQSPFSSISYLGVGTVPKPRGKGDLNGDGKVNLVDFSILLFHWGEAWSPGDLNGDGVVDLPDLSIMLYNWTG